MSDAKEKSKVPDFIKQCETENRTTNLADLLDKVQSKPIDRYLKKFSKGTTGKASKKWIDLKEAQVIFECGIVGGLDDSVSKKELHDLKFVLGYRYTGPKAKRFLVKKVIARKNLRAEQRNKVRNDPAFRSTVLAVLKSPKSHHPGGFSVRHAGGRFVYKSDHYWKISQLIGAGDIDLISYDYAGDTDVLRSRARGVHNSNKNHISINRSNRFWKSTLVHEATHAIQDWYNIDGKVGDWEVAAHLAQAVRIIKVSGGTSQLAKASKRLAQDPLRKTATAIVKSSGVYDVCKDDQAAILTVIREGGYGGKVDKNREQSIFDASNFIEFWKRI